ncbi:hypothetical protein HZA75_00695 [Candidatus Roizmanbacteria bacterium]|nr:hypothetical protein [Candidatus Roizmanbacteria bacterium]
MDSLTIIFILNGVFFISFFLLKNIYISLTLSLFTLFILLFVSKKKTIPSLRACLNLPSFTFHNSQYLNMIVCLIIFLVLEKFTGFNGALFATFFIFAYLNKLDSRTSFFIALILLVITALFSIGGRNSIAEDVAIMVYYFLIIGVIWQIIEIRQDKFQETNIDSQYLEEIVIKKYTSESIPSLNFLTKKNVILIGVSVSLSLIIFLFYSLYTKSRPVKESIPISPIALTITFTPKLFKNVPFKILNATDIRGYAASTAATLRTSGWGKEFDISIGNYDGTASASLLKYTKNLKEKIKLLKKDLKIQITPIIIKQSSHEAEMILILGD